MQPYYTIKLKCFIFRLLSGSALVLIAISLLISIVQEMIGSYNSDSKFAYGLGILICAAMIALSAMLIYQAYHFEQFVFGRNDHNYRLLKQDMENEGIVSTDNLVVTDQFVLLFSLNFLNLCMVIRMENIVACFENPVYGTVAKPTDYTLYIYDRHFKCHTIVLDEKQAEVGHLAKEKICQSRPWLYSENRDSFLDEIMTKKGRRTILKNVDNNRYKSNIGDKPEADAETEISQMANETKEKLDFKTLLEKNKKSD